MTNTAKETNSNTKKNFIGAVLKEARNSLGLTQEKVSEILGLAPRYISDIERDKTKGSLDTLVKLCNLYQITPTFILKDYLTSSSLTFENSILGYNSLNSNDKEIIKQLIHFMNKKNNS